MIRTLKTSNETAAFEQQSVGRMGVTKGAQGTQAPPPPHPARLYFKFAQDKIDF